MRLVTPPPSPTQLQQAVTALKQGGVIAYPTEAVWGLGCDPFNQQAVLKLLALKQRSPAKGLILIAATVKQVKPYLHLLTPQEYQRVLESWPSATTWLVPITPSFPKWLSGKHLSVAIRVSAHPPVQALCNAFGGAIISTSANITGQATAQNATEIAQIFGNGVSYTLEASLGGHKNPSQIRDARTGAVLRPS